MPTISIRTAALVVGTGVAALVGVMLALGPAWLVGAGDDPAATDVSGTLTWPDPDHEPRDRANRPLLELVGVMAGTGEAIAMIRKKGGATHNYRVGDRVTGNRELVEIHDTYVILRNDERLERLRLRGRGIREQADPDELREFAGQLTIRPGAAHDSPPE